MKMNSKSHKTINNLQKKLTLLGIKYNYNLTTLLNLRIVLTMILFIIFLYFLPYNIVSAPLLTIIFYYGIEYFFIDYRIKKRSKKLEIEAIAFFDILSLTIEAGRNLPDAIELTANSLNSDISLEFKHLISEIKMGKDFISALNDLKKRIPSEIIGNVILSIKDTHTFGSSLITSLNNQTEYLREKELLALKSDIAKLPIKLSVISVVFFIPIMLLIILSPVIIKIIIG